MSKNKSKLVFVGDTIRVNYPYKFNQYEGILLEIGDFGNPGKFKVTKAPTWDRAMVGKKMPLRYYHYHITNKYHLNRNYIRVVRQGWKHRKFSIFKNVWSNMSLLQRIKWIILGR